MISLAFDTCFGACSAAVFSASGELLAHRYEERQTGHAEALMPTLRDVMAEAGAGFAEVSRILVTVGPGTFTGIRIGLSVAKALALVTKAEVLTTSSLHLMALRALAEFGTAPAAGSVLVVAVDARRGELHLQTFTRNGAPLDPPALLSPDAAAAQAPNLDMIAVGSGAALLAEAGQRIGRQITAALPRLQANACYLASAVAASNLVHGSVPIPIRPLYMRPPDAKPQTGKSLPRTR